MVYDKKTFVGRLACGLCGLVPPGDTVDDQAWVIGRKLALHRVVTPENPDAPYAMDTFQAIGGSYVSRVGFEINTANKVEVPTTFPVGEFPLKQSYEYMHDYNDNGAGTNEASLVLQLVDIPWADKVGDFIKLRYLLPEVTYCKFCNVGQTADGGAYKDPSYYTFEMQLQSSDEGAKNGESTVTHSTEDGAVSYYDMAEDKPQYYSKILEKRTFQPIIDGNKLLGFELSGWLMTPITSVTITITGVYATDSTKWRYAWLDVEYSAHDNLTVEVYDISMSEAPTDGTLVGWNYGGIVLPEAPDEVKAQPYMFVGHTKTADVIYGFSGTPSTFEEFIFVYIKVIKVGTKEVGSKVRATLTDGAWDIVENVESVDSVSYTFDDVIWANFDIYDMDGNLHIAASEPEPVYEITQ